MRQCSCAERALCLAATARILGTLLKSGRTDQEMVTTHRVNPLEVGDRPLLKAVQIDDPLHFLALIDPPLRAGANARMP